MLASRKTCNSYSTMLRWVAPMCLMLAGCGERTPPSAFKNLRDQFFAVVPLQIIDDDFYPCFRTVNGREIRLPDRECYVLGPPRRMRGVVHLFFRRQGSFYPDVSVPPPLSARSQYWLKLEETVVAPDRLADCDHCYLFVDFIGRQTKVAGKHGHLGGSKHIVVIDRMLASNPVG